MSRRVLVTGASGFVGAHLVRVLVRRGDQVSVLLRRPEQAVRLRLFSVADRIAPVLGSLLDRESLQRVMQQSAPDLIYHLAAYGVQSAEQDLGESLAVNVTGAVDLVEAAATAGAGRLVWVGTSFEYSTPLTGPVPESAPTVPHSLYGATKHAGWVVAQAVAAERSLPLVTARCFAGYGPGERLSKLVPYVITSALKGSPVEITAGEQRRDYLYIDDLISGLVRMGEVPNIEGQVINLGSGTGVTVACLAETILSALGRPELLAAGARQRMRPEPDGAVADITLAGSLLGWRPQRGLAEGLTDTIAWYQEHQGDWELLQ